MVERALTRLQSDAEEKGRTELFAGIKPHLTGEEPHTPYRELSTELGMTEVALRGAVHRMRQRLGSYLRSEIAEGSVPTRRYNIVVVDKRTDKPGLIGAIERLGGKVTNEQLGSLLLEVSVTPKQLASVARPSAD